MNKELKIHLNSQREIQQEGAQENYTTRESSSQPIGRIKKEFFLPELNIDSAQESAKRVSTGSDCGEQDK